MALFQAKKQMMLKPIFSIKEDVLKEKIFVDRNKYGKHGGWDDKTSWLTLAFMFIYFTLAGIWAFS